jgi:hypothetical protein
MAEMQKEIRRAVSLRPWLSQIVLSDKPPQIAT